MMSLNEPSLMSSVRHDHVFAIVRVDLHPAAGEPPENWITIKKVVADANIAAAEVERLNKLNADKDCHYFSQVTRIERISSSASTADTDSLAALPG
jgi:hypothetical protein